MNKDYLVDPRRLNNPETGIYVRARHGEEWGPHDLAHLDRDSVTRWLRSGERIAERTALLLLFGPEADSPRTSLEDDRLFREIAASVAADMDTPTRDGQRYRRIPTIGGRCERWLGHTGDVYLIDAEATAHAPGRQGRGDNIPKLLPGDVLMRIAHAGDCYGVYAVFRGGGTGRLKDEWRGYDGVGRFIGNALESDHGMLAAVADLVADAVVGDHNRGTDPAP